MKSKPNLFDYATSELSQDAFLTWLIRWGDKGYKEIDSSLNNCATSFIQALLGEDDSYKIETVEVKKQWEKIDISVLVNEQYFIVIEDKKSSKEHSNQLDRYKKIVEKCYENQSIEIKLIYFKMEEQAHYTNVEKSGFSPFKRDKMLKVLEPYFNHTDEKKNDIISDYYKSLKKLDENIKSYKTLAIKYWNRFSWIGFYCELQKYIKEKRTWHQVNNQRGGFLGFVYGWSSFGCFLHLEEDKLVFKLAAAEEEKSRKKEARDFFRDSLFKKAKELNIPIKKHGRLGNSMGLAILVGEYRVTNEKGVLNFDKTLENLKRNIKLLDELKKEEAKYKSKS